MRMCEFVDGHTDFCLRSRRGKVGRVDVEGNFCGGHC